MRQLNVTGKIIDETELYRKANAGNEEAIQRLILLHLDSIVKVAKQHFTPGITVEELMTAGRNDLKEYFKTHNDDDKMVWWIRQAVLKVLNEKNLLT